MDRRRGFPYDSMHHMMTTSRSLILALLFSLTLHSANAQAPSRNYVQIRYLGGDPAIRNFVITADSKVADQFHIQPNYVVCLADPKIYQMIQEFWMAEAKKKNPSSPAKDAVAFEVSERAPDGTITSFNFLVTGSKSSKSSFASLARFADFLQPTKICPYLPYLLRVAIGREALPAEKPDHD